MRKSKRGVEFNFCLLAIFSLAAKAAIGADAATASDDIAGTTHPSTPGIVGLCTSCHGDNGKSSGPATPTIGGLSRNYIVGAMLAYKFGQKLDRADALVEADQDIEDVVVFARPGGIMSAVAEMLSVNEIKEIAEYLSVQTLDSREQVVDSTSVAAGADIHDRYCEKCHENGGRSTMDDVGLLAGQWKLYLSYLFEDLAAGRRQMPKKMAAKFDAVREDHGEIGFQQLIDYYAGQDVEGVHHD
jgi:sulfide dehydrogenase cytochrome subunit